jgi:hypothetical protein
MAGAGGCWQQHTQLKGTSATFLRQHVEGGRLCQVCWCRLKALQTAPRHQNMWQWQLCGTRVSFSSGDRKGFCCAARQALRPPAHQLHGVSHAGRLGDLTLSPTVSDCNNADVQHVDAKYFESPATQLTANQAAGVAVNAAAAAVSRPYPNWLMK